jgi:hypothetical protein
MASELGSSVNGVYGGQYGQPAELAASIPSSTQVSAVSQTATEPAANTTVADPQQIGWYFVEQYYTTLSKNPDQLHLFYSKKSQLVTGVEAEKVLPSVGSKVSLDDMIARSTADRTDVGHQRQDQGARHSRLQSPRSKC